MRKSNQMETALSRPIAEGRTAEIYEWGDGYILKLYHAWCPSHWVEDEAKVARAVTDAGVPTPAVGGVVEINGRQGLVYERVTGISMLQDLNTRPWTFMKHAQQLAQLHSQINQLRILELLSYKDGLKHSIQQTSHLDESLRGKVLKKLAELQDGESICHGDFHPGNVLLTDSGPVVIDWMTARRGNRWADVARTSLLLDIGAKRAGKQVKPVAKLFIRIFCLMYIRRYCKLNLDPRNELAHWMPVIAAARLNEDIAPEREALIKMVEEG